MCGGTAFVDTNGGARTGLSPRVRGNQQLHRHPCRRPGSIPACAGEPYELAREQYYCEVYPRVCGGTDHSFLRVSYATGLSPRVRGNLCELQIFALSSRSIPACAGEPGDNDEDGDWDRVYPRVCGGTHKNGAKDLPYLGLSPRVRGNRPVNDVAVAQNRSIPACAGEPPFCLR